MNGNDSRPAPRILAEALAAHQAGDLMRAERGYRSILAATPADDNALHLLGVVAYQCGQIREAEALIRQAIRHCPTIAVYHNNLGEVLRTSAQHGAACEAFERAIALKADYPEAWNNLGIVAEAGHNPVRARAAFQRATLLRPDYFEAWHNLGGLEATQGNAGAALEAFARAAQLNPSSVPTRLSLADLFQRAGQLEDALRCCEEALQLSPDQAPALERRAHVLLRLGRWPDAARDAHRAVAVDPQLAAGWNTLGVCLTERREFTEAHDAFRRSIALQPRDPSPHCNRAIAFQREKKWHEALAAVQVAATLEPASVHPWINQGAILLDLFRPSDALRALDRALAIDPQETTGLANKAAALMLCGQSGAALALYRRLSEITPPRWSWCSSYLYALTAAGEQPADEVAHVHREVGARLEQSLQEKPLARARSRAAKCGRWRIGFVSADLREHAVACFLEPLWQHYDRKKLEIFAYADVPQPDHRTRRLAGYVDTWRNIHELSDQAALKTIRDDAIDILFDLAGHTVHNRLPLFAQRAAPVQCSWLGYPNTTGLSSLDFRLTDGLVDPPGRTEKLYVEKLVRLDGPAWCFRAPDHAPPTGDLPAMASGRVTFCSFNNPVKISGPTIRLWARVLHAVDGSKLLLKGRGLGDTGLRTHITTALQAQGIATDRIIFHEWTAGLEEHFATYAQADIALDTFPYHGTTTTCEALWMGVPVITLAGDAPAARVGRSLLTHAGLPELTAWSENEFVAVARRLARELEILRQLRATLRRRLANSVVMDGSGFARRFEQAAAAMAEA